MDDILKKVKETISGLVGIVVAFLVLIVFANMVFDTGMDPIAGIINFVGNFLNNGFTGLLALVVFVWFVQD
ncbi:MAG: hypothetical protein HN995_09510 [Candidatus Marinimicrobia bacterium]|jgi:hypothetical protein|nr:hypothetical protein [Candidatus Neomarinimicrobiota bacterium]MBT4129717.1 hypothetical protein [Candidatus Neomarinimicrobiota bacterium]MBT4296840.1 hypothetical protein [Candidatus Neomarinimicrobiota bacterium]MBT4419259.1 hypothetical protein [Candidatus Neomarinimicrobiota bacterium]MBT4993397.1 hypothetical protein [Candidatus Neomarinimicrobiota bacterium]